MGFRPHFFMTLLAAHNALRGAVQRQIDRGQMSVKLLAHLAGLKPPQASNFIHGRRNLSVRSMSRVIAAIGFEVELLPKAHAATDVSQRL